MLVNCAKHTKTQCLSALKCDTWTQVRHFCCAHPTKNCLQEWIFKSRRAPLPRYPNIAGLLIFGSEAYFRIKIRI